MTKIPFENFGFSRNAEDRQNLVRSFQISNSPAQTDRIHETVAFPSFFPFYRLSLLIPILELLSHPSSDFPEVLSSRTLLLQIYNEGVHLDPHRSGRHPGRKLLLGALLSRTWHQGQIISLFLFLNELHSDNISCHVSRTDKCRATKQSAEETTPLTLSSARPAPGSTSPAPSS